MLSIFLQITGNILLVYAVITQNFSDMTTESAFSLSNDLKRKRIIGKLTTKWEILFGFIYVIIGLIVSLPKIATKLESICFLNNYFVNIVITIILLFIAFMVTKLIVYSNKKKIEEAVNQRIEGETWIE